MENPMRLIPEYLYQELIKRGLITEATFEKSNIQQQEQRRLAINQILEKIPPDEREDCKTIIESIYDHPDTDWNKDLEFVYKGETLEGSNIVDLSRVHYKRPNKRIAKAFEFFKILQDILIVEHRPPDYIKYIGFPYSWTDAEFLDALKYNDDNTPT